MSEYEKIPSASQEHTGTTLQPSSGPERSNPADIIPRISADLRSVSPVDALILQRSIGNRAVSRLLSQPGTWNPVQRSAEIAGKPDNAPSTFEKSSIETHNSLRGPNRTGLPDELKDGVESLSGMSLDEVRVHYNSNKPAQIGAAAYTQGSEIHVAPGQEQHLPHEAWHVVQQTQGRVKPTLQLQGLAVNDDEGLEREADARGRDSLISRKTDVLPGEGGVIQNKVIQCAPIRFRGRNGGQIDIEPRDIVVKIHQSMISTMQQGWPMPPMPDPQEVFPPHGQLNFQEQFPTGPPRRAENIKDYYKLTKEVKSTPGAFFSIEHGAGVASDQLLPHVTNVNSPRDLRLVDEYVKGEVDTYNDIRQSVGEIKAATGANDRVIARQYLNALAGQPLDAAFNNAAIKSKMYSHMDIMVAAESRRDAGMFPFTQIGLQNVADGKQSFDQLLATDKNDQAAFPAAFEGSKGPLITMEAMLKAGRPIGYNRAEMETQIHAQTQSAAIKPGDYQLVLKRMENQIEMFFKQAGNPVPDRTDFSRVSLQNLPGADFNDQLGALEAIINMIKRDYFSSIPAMFEQAPPPPQPQPQEGVPTWSTPDNWNGTAEFPQGHPLALPDVPMGRVRTADDRREMGRNKVAFTASQSARSVLDRKRQLDSPESDMREQMADGFVSLAMNTEPWNRDRPQSPDRTLGEMRHVIKKRDTRLKKAANDPQFLQGEQDAREGKPKNPDQAADKGYVLGYDEAVTAEGLEGLRDGIMGRARKDQPIESYLTQYEKGAAIRQAVLVKAVADVEAEINPDPKPAIEAATDVNELTPEILLTLTSIYTDCYFKTRYKKT